ncbi:MAG: hypothetical protein O2960_16645 [Verrucomicrobia bacterium]|nr:hypothetical protein [Verrucomicrobiota bacterium]
MRSVFLTLLSCAGVIAASALDFTSVSSTASLTEEDFYRIETVPAPKEAVLEVGGLCRMNDGTLMVCTRRGEIWARRSGEWRRFASGLDEPMGLCPTGSNQVVVAQRPELTRLTDTDSDGEADLFETLADHWNYSGHIYEWTFGPVADRAGNLYGTLACWFFPATLYDKPPYSGWEIPPPPFHGPSADTAWRGWCFQIIPSGEFIPFANGLRSPNGLALSPEGDLFVSDNQGEYRGACALYHVTQGAFLGHPNGLFWGPEATPDPFSVPLEELDRRSKLPAIVFPFSLMGQSLAQPLFDETGGRFGPFTGQMFIGDQTHSTVMRVALEKVKGEYQGACFPFRRGFQCGVNRMLFEADGSLLVGQTDRGWASLGGQHEGLQRLVWTGRVPFEIERMTVRPDGFELNFTRPLAATAPETNALTLRHFRYPYRRAYGGPALDIQSVPITALEVSGDRRKARLVLPPLVPRTIYHLRASGLKADDGSPLLHDAAFYTLNQVPDS